MIPRHPLDELEVRMGKRRCLRLPNPILRLLAAVLLLLSPAALAGQTAHGALLPSGSTPVGPDRYRSPSGYPDTVKFYLKAYSPEHFPRTAIAALPGVRALHIENPTGHEAWEGLNIYELNGETRIFVLTHAPASRKHP
jgi:hypothetical protein